MEHPGEIWQELDFNGERSGGIKPDDYNEDEIKFYYGVALMLYRFKNGEVEYLFQHRSKFLKGNPDKWDVSAGGHINLGEPRIDAVLRESKEEIGIELDKNKLEMAAIYSRWIVMVGLYFYDWTGEVDEFKFNDKEVEEVEWVGYSELDKFWPNLKRQVAEDKVFKYYLEEWNRKILAKYENL